VSSLTDLLSLEPYLAEPMGWRGRVVSLVCQVPAAAGLLRPTARARNVSYANFVIVSKTKLWIHSAFSGRTMATRETWTAYDII